MAKYRGSAQAHVALLDRAALQAGGALVCEEHGLFARSSNHETTFAQVWRHVALAVSMVFERLRKAV
jgi:hypothetical protein